MRFGIEIAEFAWLSGRADAARRLADVATHAEASGLSVIGVGDHVWQGPQYGGPDEDFLECHTTLGFLAGATERIQLMSGVSPVHLREPMMLLKGLTSLAALTDGRVTFGFGVGWDADEAEGSGIEFGSTGERFDRLEDLLGLTRAVLAGSSEPFVGTHVRVPRPQLRPLPATAPTILLGGAGDRTLRLVAEYGNACNLFPTPDLAERLETLHRFCDRVGRDHGEISKTVMFPFDEGTADAQRRLVDALAGLGIDTVIGIAGPDPLRSIDYAAGVLAADLAESA